MVAQNLRRGEPQSFGPKHPFKFFAYTIRARIPDSIPINVSFNLPSLVSFVCFISHSWGSIPGFIPFLSLSSNNVYILLLILNPDSQIPYQCPVPIFIPFPRNLAPESQISYLLTDHSWRFHVETITNDQILSKMTLFLFLMEFIDVMGTHTMNENFTGNSFGHERMYGGDYSSRTFLALMKPTDWERQLI